MFPFFTLLFCDNCQETLYFRAICAFISPICKILAFFLTKYLFKKVRILIFAT